MTYAIHLKTTAMNEIWKASGRGFVLMGNVKYERICKLMRYLERVK